MAKPKTETKEKLAGRVFTPAHLVEFMLDLATYVPDDSILGRHVADNSCGEGAFLEPVVRRYAEAYRKKSGDKKGLRKDLEKFVHGIELDAETHANCLRRLDGVADELGLGKVQWDVRCGDALAEAAFDGRMDWVVGNPPYVRVHNLGSSAMDVKRQVFSQGGMTDLYLSFYELGFRMLAPKGRLCYVTPSSWFNSLAGTNMRAWILGKRNLAELFDLGHYQPFEATAYVAVALFEDGKRHDTVRFGTYGEDHTGTFVDDIPLDEAWFGDSFRFARRDRLRWLRELSTMVVPRAVVAKNGFATLADDVFVADSFPFGDWIIPTVKASTGKWRKAFYPYDKLGKPLPKKTVFSNRRVAEWLEERKERLLKGKPESAVPDWHLYGRTQALADVWKDKWAVNSVVRDADSLKLTHAPVGSGVYGGLYILGNVPADRLLAALSGDDFYEYVALLQKYKSGGYYTFNTKELTRFLNWKLASFPDSGDTCRLA